MTGDDMETAADAGYPAVRSGTTASGDTVLYCVLLLAPHAKLLYCQRWEGADLKTGVLSGNL